MPLFTYAGEAGRYYPTIGLTPEPDVAYALDEAPDSRFVEITADDAAEMARVEAERVEADRVAAETTEPASPDVTEGS